MTKIEFGTDGIRGKAGQFPIDEESIHLIGLAMISLLSERKKVVIARDTRDSGVWITNILKNTLTRHGVHVVDCGILPTAALACVVVDESSDLGIVITASHNPWEDNGIKVFNAKGGKLSSDEQHKLQNAIGTSCPKGIGSYSIHKAPSKAWRSRLPNVDLSGWKVLLDCAHGSLSPFGEEILLSQGASVLSIAASPNGKNINDGVGALHPPNDLCGNDIALCFDGDADRIIMKTPIGTLDGDDFLWLMRNDIEGPMVGTIMSNGGLEKALQGRLHRSKVGDKHVASKMKEIGAMVGAEPSGHVIFNGPMPAGDGLYAALRILQIISKPPVQIDWKRWPTAQANIVFQGERVDLSTLKSIQNAQKHDQRLVVRYSGTEPKLRILVEGDQAETWCSTIAHEFKENYQ